jgi:pyruvate dehydrogenase E2 component (dihydrolipoamide acetyltransferase)
MAETITMPKLGFDMQEGTLVRWVRNEGENINKGDVLAEIETDKATVEVESSASGVVRRLLVEQGAVVPIGAAIAVVGTKDEKISLPAPAEAPSSVTRASQAAAEAKAGAAPAVEPGTSSMPSAVIEATGMLKASPLARKMAREAQLDLKRLSGTGPGGRIVRKDIEALLSGGAATATSDTVLHPVPAVRSKAAEDETVQLTKLRLTIARRMTESKSSVPHFYVTHEYRVESLLDLREQANSTLPEDQKISVNDFIVVAAASCLREFPNLNATFQGDRILRHGAINIGVAVAIEGGLLTVVCRDADQKPLRQVATELKAMAVRARSGRLRPADIEGSTFSVSNLGMFDVENFAAIINPPEAAILAIGSARQVPVIDKGEVGAGWRMKATIAVDHRVSDGAEAARFMQVLAQYIETPLRLFL